MERATAQHLLAGRAADLNGAEGGCNACQAVVVRDDLVAGDAVRRQRDLSMALS